MTRQQAVIGQLLAVRRSGVSLGNVSQAVAALVDAVVYLVENTPEARK